MLNNPKTAIILSAGLGTRMPSFTRFFPKCMAPIKETTIIENALNVLKSIGVKNVVVVYGYLGDKLISYCDALNSSISLNIAYVENKNYKTTNSMYSLYIALSDVTESCWVVEADVFFQKDFFSNFSPSPTLTWMGDSSYRRSGGAFLQINSSGVLDEVSIIDSIDRIKVGMIKSAGVFYLNGKKTKVVHDWLHRAIEDGKSALYYDLILAEHAKEMPIYVHDIWPAKWAEIDTLEELEEAKRLFL